MHRPRHTPTLALAPLALAALAALAPRPADACSPDLCAEVGRWQTIAQGIQTEVPTDGVFVLQGYRSDVGDAGDTIPMIAATVTLDGTPVDGALESVGFHDLLIWRPAAPLAASSTYLLDLAVDNAAIAPNDLDCGLDLLEAQLTYTTSDGPAPPLNVDFLAEENVSSYPIEELDTLVCCDGAYPEGYETCGWLEIDWKEGTCAATKRRGSLQVSWKWDTSLPAAHLGMVAFRPVIDGTPKKLVYTGGPSHSAQAAFCGHAEVVSLVDGSVVAGADACFGQMPANPLGEYDVDPLTELGACVGTPYTCQIQPTGFGEGWDPGACTPVPGGDDTSSTGATDSAGTDSAGTDSAGTDSAGTDSAGTDSAGSGTDSATATGGEDDGVDKGCACTSAPEGRSAPWLAALALLGLTRRRR